MDLNDALGISSSTEQSQSSSLDDVRSSMDTTPVDCSDVQLDSGLTTPARGLMRHSSEVKYEMVERNKPGQSEGQAKGSFLGFYASLERSVAEYQDAEEEMASAERGEEVGELRPALAQR